MALRYHPAPGIVVICDFTFSFRVPEMVKRRPSIVISPQMQGREELCTVIPISTDKPRRPCPFHVELPDLHLPPPYEEGPNWAKCDMQFAASFSRLDLFRTERVGGKREYLNIAIPPSDLKRIRCGALAALGLAYLTKHTVSLICRSPAALPFKGSAFKTSSEAGRVTGDTKPTHGCRKGRLPC